MNKRQAEAFMREMEIICQQAIRKIQHTKNRLGEEAQIDSSLVQAIEVLNAKRKDAEIQAYLSVFEAEDKAKKEKSFFSSAAKYVGAAVKDNVNTNDLANEAREVNEALRKNIEEFEGILLYQGAELEEREKQELAKRSAILLDLIQIRIGTLNKIAKIANAKYDTNLPGKAHIKEHLDNLGKALFGDKDQHENKLLKSFSDFFGKKLNKIGIFFQGVFRKTPVKTPESIGEFLKTGKEELFDIYYKAEMYDDESDVWRQMAYQQHQKKNLIREKQLNLLAEVMKNGKIDRDDSEDIKLLKLKQLKGCLLAIKHQVEGEWKAFDSRLEGLVNAYLKIPELQGVSIEESVETFRDYASILKKQQPSLIDDSMMKKIEKSAADTQWLEKLDNLEKRAPKRSL